MTPSQIIVLIIGVPIVLALSYATADASRYRTRSGIVPWRCYLFGHTPGRRATSGSWEWGALECSRCHVYPLRKDGRAVRNPEARRRG